MRAACSMNGSWEMGSTSGPVGGPLVGGGGPATVAAPVAHCSRYQPVMSLHPTANTLRPGDAALPPRTHMLCSRVSAVSCSMVPAAPSSLGLDSAPGSSKSGSPRHALPPCFQDRCGLPHGPRGDCNRPGGPQHCAAAGAEAEAAAEAAAAEPTDAAAAEAIGPAATAATAAMQPQAHRPAAAVAADLAAAAAATAAPAARPFYV